MKCTQVASLVVALGFALPVVAQNSVVRSSDFLGQNAVTVSSKVAFAYQKPVVAVAQIPGEFNTLVQLVQAADGLVEYLSNPENESTVFGE